MKISKTIVENIFEHGQKEIPDEACGYLAGLGELVTHIYPMTNMDHSPEHFSLDPQEQFAIIKTARNAGLSILAVYHTHPATPARPSEEDIRLAYDPNIIYIIASLLEEKIIKAFKISKDKVKEIDLEII